MEKHRKQESEEKKQPQQKQQQMAVDSPPAEPTIKFEPIIKEQNKTHKPASDETRKNVVEDSCMADTVVEHVDGAEAIEEDDDSDSDDELMDVDGHNSDDDDENVIIKPKNPMSFVPKSYVHSSIPQDVLRYQREQLQREDELRKKGKLPPVTSSTKFKTLPLKETVEENHEDDYGYEDEESDDLVCFAEADGHASLPPKVHSSHR